MSKYLTIEVRKLEVQKRDLLLFKHLGKTEAILFYGTEGSSLEEKWEILQKNFAELYLSLGWIEEAEKFREIMEKEKGGVGW